VQIGVHDREFRSPRKKGSAGVEDIKGQKKEIPLKTVEGVTQVIRGAKTSCGQTGYAATVAKKRRESGLTKKARKYNLRESTRKYEENMRK